MLESIFRILALVCKELLAILKEPRSRAVVIGPPIFQCLLFGYGASYDLNVVPYALLDQDRGEAARTLVARLDGSGVFRRVATLRRESEIREVIDNKNALLVVQIEPKFERNIMAGGPSPLQVVADGRNSNTAGTAAGYISGIVEDFNSEWRKSHGSSAQPVRIVTRAWYNPAFETRWMMIPSLIGTLTLLGTLLLTALSVAREREQGTFEQLLVTPLRPAEIMIGKSVPSMLVGLFQATTILLVAQLWFQIPFRGSFPVLYTGLACFLMAATGIGLFISAFSATMQQAMLYSFMVLMPSILLSGLTTPVSNMPEVMQTATLINPLRYGINIARRIYLEGADLTLLMGDLLPLIIIGVIMLSLSAWLFRRRLT